MGSKNRKGGIPLTDEELKHRLQVFIECGGQPFRAAKVLGLSSSSTQHTLNLLRQRGMLTTDMIPEGVPERDRLEWQEEKIALKDKVRELEGALASVQRENVTAKTVREYIIGLAGETPNPPSWLVRSLPKKSRSPGTPMTIWAISDLHLSFSNAKPMHIFGENGLQLSVFFPLFGLAIALGFAYEKTRNLVVVWTIHAAFNGWTVFIMLT